VRRFAPAAVVAAVLSFCCGSAPAASLQPIGNFDQPIYVTSSPVDPDRLLIAEREGRVVERTPSGTRELADLTELVSCCDVERGMLSIAPAPDFENSGRIYATYTGTLQAGGAVGDIHLDSFLLGTDGAAPVREQILTVGHDQEANHNGGQLQFGPDGHLYVAFGDGGGTGDPFENGQDPEALLGKLLRIDPRPGQTPAYSIPVGNPFVGMAGRDEIWSSGLRNPWRFSFDRANGDLVIADVGQGAREEVDFAPSPAAGMVAGAGLNYGWNCREGLIAYSGAPAGCPSSGFTDPVFDYPHGDPGGVAAFGCSIIGGYVARDAGVPDLYGRYVYADYCTKGIRSLVLPSAGRPAGDDRSEGLAVAKPTSFGEDSCGRLYVASAEGPVYRFDGPAPTACPPPVPPVPAPAGSKSSPGSKSNSKVGPVRLLLSAKRLRPGGTRFKVKVRLAPCRNGAGKPLQLNRNGKSFAGKALSRRCRARFWLTVAKPTPIRAFVRLSDEAGRVGSHRLVLLPPRRR
jgi:hypothetical protein